MITPRLYIWTLMLLATALPTFGAQSEKDDDRWLILKGQEASNPVIVSARQVLGTVNTRQRYINAVTLEWSYPVVGRGMPPDELLREMYSFEDKVVQELLKGELALLAATRTGNGLRRWIYYLVEDPSALAKLKHLTGTQKGNVKVVSVSRDPGWASLAAVLAAVERK